MANELPRLRMSLDFMPSPDHERPGLFIRDPFRFSDSMLLIPPQLVECLACFDGEQTSLDLRASLVRITGEIDTSELEGHLYETLSSAGFLEDDTFARLREERMKEFASADKREPAHAGSGYPDDPEGLRETWREYMIGTETEPPANGLVGIAAPHVSPFGGWESYRDAYRCLPESSGGRTFIILGTSHYGEPDKFGLTLKNFVTPFGEARTNSRIVNRLLAEAPAAVRAEDYCHAVEHSIEFQVLYLQYLFGPGVNIVPILCGPFARSLYRGGKPEDSPEVARFFDSLGNIAAAESSQLTFILGIDMAHMGRRYGDPLEARADQGAMLEVASRDRARLDRVTAGDASGFWDLVQQNQDDLKWCGSAPLYTFLKIKPETQASVRRYQQWNIDDSSVVSFGAIEFHA